MNRQGKVLMLVENAYPNDTRVKNEADALTDAGYSVTVVALRRAGQPSREDVDNVHVYRVPRLELFRKTPRDHATRLQRLVLGLQALVGYITEYLYFTSACLAMSLYVACRHGFDVLHAHNPPDTLFLVALPWKLVGKKYIFDHHDLCPELYRSRYGAANNLLPTLLAWIEWANLKLADVVIATNESYRAIQIQRGGRRADTIVVVRNGPSHRRMRIVQPTPRLRELQKNILVYIGALNPQDGVDYLLRSLKYLSSDLGRTDFHCMIIGSGDSLDDLRRLAIRLQLNGHVEFTGYISDTDLERHLAAADICVDPDPSSPLNDVSTWIKVMEYMAYAKPIVAFDLRETRVSAQGAALFVPCNDEHAFARALATLMDDPALRQTMGRVGRDRVETELQWSVVSKNLLRAYDIVLAPR
jgi:glycosyltransferase involved in cell wall biosynthesis